MKKITSQKKVAELRKAGYWFSHDKGDTHGWHCPSDSPYSRTVNAGMTVAEAYRNLVGYWID